MTTRSHKNLLFITLSLFSIIGYSYFAFAAAPLGGYNPGDTLNPDCAPGDVDCVVTLPSGGSGWSLNGNAGTTAGTNFIGTTDAQDFVVKTNGNQVALFGQNKNIVFGDSSIATGNYAIAFGTNSEATGNLSFAWGDKSHATAERSTAWGESYANGMMSTAFGSATADGGLATAWGDSNTSIGDNSTSFGKSNTASSFSETAIGLFSTNYGAISATSFSSTDRLFNIGNGINNGSRSDAFTILKNGQTGVGYDNFQNNTLDSLLQVNGPILSSSLSGSCSSLGSDADGKIVCGGGSGWSLTGNAGTTAGTNFIGTTDAQDFVIAANGNEMMRFLQDADLTSTNVLAVQLLGGTASGNASFAWSQGNATGIRSTAWSRAAASGIDSTAWGTQSIASGGHSTAWGDGSEASGSSATAFGLSNIASGDSTTVFGQGNFGRSHNEVVFGFNNVDYIPLDPFDNNQFDRLLAIGNGNAGVRNNAYTLFKDGSFAYNDDNFQNDTPGGSPQNMFYFNYGNHDGLGGVNTKSAIRLGSVQNDEWDINSVNTGDYSIALGFSNPACISGSSTAIASGQGSVAIGCATTASGRRAVAIGDGNQATGDNATAFGGSQNIAQGAGSVAFGQGVIASNNYETAFGTLNTIGINRLVTIGNGTGVGSESDAFTILSSDQTGIAIDNFEANTNGNIFQVGDGTTNIIGYVDDVTGNWVAVSDERKKDNITDLSYGLNELLQLRPTSFNYKRNNEHTIGFLAQQVLPIIPEAVYGTESEGYGMSYTTLTPVIVKAIQEMNLNITMLSDTARPNTWRDALIAWFESTTNGIRSLVVHDKICVDDQCLTKNDIQALLQLKDQQNNISNPPNPGSSDPIPNPDPDSGTPPSGDNSGDAPADDSNSQGPSDPGSNPTPDVPATE